MIVLGQGNVSFNIPDIIPAVPVTGANNGLTVVAGNVQLGGANTLLHDTTVFLGSHNLLFSGIFNYLLLDQANSQAVLGDKTGTGNFLADLGNGIAVMGDSFNQVNGSRISVDDINEEILLNLNQHPYLSLKNSTKFYILGDVDNSNQSSRLVIDDATPEITLEALGQQYLRIDPTNNQYYFGAIASGNSTSLTISDNNELVSFNTGGFSILSLNANTQIYQLGPSGGFNQTYFQVDDGSSTFETNSRGFVQGLKVIATTLPTVTLGDIAASGHGCTLTLDDNNRKLIFVGGDVRIPDGGLTVRGSTGYLVETVIAMTNVAGASLGTITNSPTAGNPAKWISINDAGVTRKIPTWL